MSIIQKIVKIANELDKRGLYDEANLLDKIAEEYQDYDPGPVDPPQLWELELMQYDMSPEEREKQKEYEEHEVPTDPKEVEELIVRMKMLLKDVDDPDVGEGPGYLAPQEESKDVGEKWYFGTEGEPEEEFVYPEDMSDDQYKLVEPSQPRSDEDQKAFEDWVSGRTFAPSTPRSQEDVEKWFEERTFAPSEPLSKRQIEEWKKRRDNK
jgi:hypothetical protein